MFSCCFWFVLYTEPWPSGRVMIYHFSIFSFQESLVSLFWILFQCSFVGLCWWHGNHDDGRSLFTWLFMPLLLPWFTFALTFASSSVEIVLLNIFSLLSRVAGLTQTHLLFLMLWWFVCLLTSSPGLR
jgi:hypothetical protein